MIKLLIVPVASLRLASPLYTRGPTSRDVVPRNRRTYGRPMTFSSDLPLLPDVPRSQRTALTGAAGAYATASVLAQHLWAPSMTVGNMPRTDIVAQHLQTNQVIAIQCKTSSPGSSIQVGLRGEHPAAVGANEWYVCIELASAGLRPDFYVLPRNVIAAFVSVGHRAWLAGKKRDGSARKDSSMRTCTFHEIAAYKERWDLLHHPASTIPYWVPDWFFDQARTHKLPAGHPSPIRDETFTFEA